MDILGLWNKYSRLPFGKFLFHRNFYRTVPYSSSVYPCFKSIEAGYAHVEMEDRPSIRNHLKSVHAVALMNIAELATGVALMTALPSDARAILKGLKIEYLKKARGRLSVEARHPLILSSEKKDIELNAEIKNLSGEVVSRVTALWQVGPAR